MCQGSPFDSLHPNNRCPLCVPLFTSHSVMEPCTQCYLDYLTTWNCLRLSRTESRSPSFPVVGWILVYIVWICPFERDMCP